MNPTVEQNLQLMLSTKTGGLQWALINNPITHAQKSWSATVPLYYDQLTGKIEHFVSGSKQHLPETIKNSNLDELICENGVLIEKEFKTNSNIAINILRQTIAEYNKLAQKNKNIHHQFDIAHPLFNEFARKLANALSMQMLSKIESTFAKKIVLTYSLRDNKMFFKSATIIKITFFADKNLIQVTCTIKKIIGKSRIEQQIKTQISEYVDLFKNAEVIIN